MTDTIESFVEKLQQDGVEAGKAEAQRIVADAKGESERIVADANKQAERIIANARAEAERATEQGRNELQLAARDVFNRLRTELAEAIGEVLKRSAGQALSDGDFLAKLIHDIVAAYAKQDAEGIWPIEMKIGSDDAEALIAAALTELSAESPDAKLTLAGRLKSAGFEYAVSGGTVEVTDASVAAGLSEMIAPKLREILQQTDTDAGE